MNPAMGSSTAAISMATRLFATRPIRKGTSSINGGSRPSPRMTASSQERKSNRPPYWMGESGDDSRFALFSDGCRRIARIWARAVPQTASQSSIALTGYTHVLAQQPERGYVQFRRNDG